MDSHQHFHVAGRKGTQWVSLYTGCDSMAFDEALRAAGQDVSYDEVRPCGHITPGFIVYPKQIAEQKRVALENVRARTAEEIAAEKEAIDAEKRRQELREAEFTLRNLFATELNSRDPEAQKKLELDIKTAKAKVDSIRQAHADLAEQKKIDAELAAIDAETAAQEQKVKTLQDRRKQLSKKK